MARINHDTSGKTYFNIIEGKFAERTFEGAPGSVSRFSKKANNGAGATLHEILNDKLSGIIENMKIEKSEKYGKQLIIIMKDVMDVYKITVPVESKYFDSFCLKIENVNLKEEVTLAPYSFMPKDSTTKRIGMNILQNGDKVPYFYSKENLGEKPVPESEKMDEDDWKAFKIIERKYYCGVIEKVGKAFPAPSESTDKATITDAAPEDDDLGLPF